MVENDYYIDIYHVRVFKWSDIQKTACRAPKWNETQYSKQTNKKWERWWKNETYTKLGYILSTNKHSWDTFIYV